MTGGRGLWAAAVVILLAPLVVEPGCTNRPVDLSLASDIASGCAYANSWLYIGNRTMYAPRIIGRGSPRPMLGRFTVPEYVVLVYGGKTANITALRDVRCAVKQLQP